MSGSDALFAGYRLEQRIAIDTVSTTYRAISQTRSRPRRAVALRIAEPLDGGSAFFAALGGAVSVQHPALVTICDAGTDDGRLYVATDLVTGPTLDAYLRHRGPLPAAAAVALLWPVAEGLDRAHAAGVVHGAISPRTIHVTGDGSGPGTAILTGFGLATLLARRVRTDRDGVDVVDVCYVAPEQLRGRPSDGTDARVDQYALACALYHCVAGRPPFVRDTTAAMFGAHLFSEARVPAGRDGDGWLAAAIATALAKHPADRHASCTALMHAAAGAGGASSRRSTAPPRAAAPPSPRSTTPARRARRVARRRVRRRRLPVAWPVAAMIVLAGMVCTLLLAALLDDGDPDDSGGVTPVGGQVPAGAVLPGTPDGSAPPRGPHWQRQLGHGAVSTLRVSAAGVVAVAGRTVAALRAEDGAVRWSARTGPGALTDMEVTGQIVGLRATRLRALSLRDGAPRWDDVDILTPVGALTASDEIVYGVRRGLIASEVVALDATTGRQRWRFGGGSVTIAEDATLGVGGGHVAVLSDDNLLVLDADQAPADARDGRAARWRRDVPRPWRLAPVVLADVVVVALRDGRVCAYALTDGVRRWCADVVGLDEHEPVIVPNGDVVAVVMPFHVTALARGSGAQQWVHDAGRALVPIATGHGRDVVVVDGAGIVRGLDVAGGHERWRGSGFGEITALTSDARAIYAGTRDGRVIRIRPDGVRRWS